MSKDEPTPPANAEAHLDRIRREHRALAILRALERSSCYTCNTHVLTDWLNMLAIGGTHEVVRSASEELEKLGAVQVAEIENIFVVTLTEHGADLATGRKHLVGVLRPWPECQY